MRRAFTLIELLVVIGVIGLLTAITIPTINVFRARANSAKCLGHLRVLGVGLNAYLAEHDNIMPTMEAGRKDIHEDLPVVDNTLNSYVDDPRVFTCPGDPGLARTTGTSYYWNSTLNGQPLAGLNFLGYMKDLSLIPLLVDKEGWHKYTDEKVNHLYADGHATKEFRFTVE